MKSKEGQKTFQFSSRGLLNVLKLNLPKDFTFLVGEKQPYTEYKVPKFLADFISPIVSFLHHSDCACDSFIVRINDSNNVFGKIFDLLTGEGKIVDKSNDIVVLKKIFKKLGNNDILNNSPIFKPQLNNHSVFENLTFKFYSDSDAREKRDFISNIIECKADIDYIASNIHSDELNFKGDILKDLPLEILIMIFSSPQLVVKDELELYETIESIYKAKNDPEYLILFANVVFQNLHPSVTESFPQFVDPKNLCSPLLEAIKARFLVPVIEPYGKKEHLGDEGRYGDDNRHHIPTYSVPYVNEKCEGIISYLKEKMKSASIVDAGIISVLAVGESSTYRCKILFDADKNKFWSIEECAGNYLLIRFNKGRVRINGYSWKSAQSNSRWDKELSWKLEGSLNARDWDIIDVRDDNKDLNGGDKSFFWSCPLSPIYKFIKWTITKNGTSSRNSKAFELYGEYLDFQKIDTEEEDYSE